jgi:hypothetical protein
MALFLVSCRAPDPSRRATWISLSPSVVLT